MSPTGSLLVICWINFREFDNQLLAEKESASQKGGNRVRMELKKLGETSLEELTGAFNWVQRLIHDGIIGTTGWRRSSMNRGSLVSYTTSSGNTLYISLLRGRFSNSLLEEFLKLWRLLEVDIFGEACWTSPSIHLEFEELELDRRELDKQEVEQPEVDRFDLDEPGVDHPIFESIEGVLFQAKSWCPLRKMGICICFTTTRDVRELHRRSDLVKISDVGMRIFFVMSEELLV
ncbi:hypothetical protein Tco_0662472 [Tanacetum coccineum]